MKNNVVSLDIAHQRIVFLKLFKSFIVSLQTPALKAFSKLILEE